MLQISKPPVSFHNEQIHSYEQVTKGNSIRTKTVSALLAKTMLTWLGERISTTPIKISDLAEEFNVVDDQKKLFTALIHILQRGKYLKGETRLVSKSTFDTKKLDETVDGLNRQGLDIFGEDQWLKDAVGPSFDLAQACIPQLPQLLKGEITGVQLLFSPENYKRTMGIYSDHLQEVYYGLIAEKIVDRCHQIWALHPNRQIRVLEIGAGSGRGTVRILEGLREYGPQIHYCFTDIGNSFLRRAKKTFKSFSCELDFRLLDISKDPKEQGFEYDSIDIAFATNVLHATPNLRVTLNNTIKLLAEGGSVFINEISSDLASNTVSFGTTPGWWLHNDGLRIPYSPVVSPTTFRQLLADSGFKNISVTGYPGVPENELPQVIIQGVKK